MLNLLLPVALSVTAGACIVLQQALIANLRIALNSSAWAGFASYFVGLLSMVVLALALRDPLPATSLTARIPWWAWSGGFFGAVFIALATILVPELGAATFLALLVTGQMLASVAFDHFWLARPRPARRRRAAADRRGAPDRWRRPHPALRLRLNRPQWRSSARAAPPRRRGCSTGGR
ncbi:uncharacterized membrane protein YdcZ (DUF606 family) [Methylobacterium goesingense]|uniref:Uncharacterized membrane protein YdcZ (DUF606 family) n=1 Tax=Methylobacterium goesingense TaxID=243690 RepID=A0ABV2L6X5_9HYPH